MPDHGQARKASRIPNRLTLGIDEAGRGPSIGPMVMAAVALDSKPAAALTRKGLRDSKAYGAGDDAHAIRCELAAEIRARAMFVATIEVEHTEIDERVCRGELNVLERELATQLIDQAPDGRQDHRRRQAHVRARSALRYPHVRVASIAPRRSTPRSPRRRSSPR